MKKFVVLSLLFLASCSSGLSRVPAYTVMITNLAQNSGGSGSVISRSTNTSEVLTNAHVCEVVRKGGIVHESATGIKHAVISFKQSLAHDLCLIKIEGDVGAAAPLANRAPAMYEPSIVSGHPKLLPNIITTGHFSAKMLVPVMIGFRDCTTDDFSNPDTGAFCAIVGKLPLIQIYQSIVTSATIQPGSSGSAVYNSRGEISAVIFAGGGDLGYGMAVPYEYVAFFLKKELSRLQEQVPNLMLGGAAVRDTSRRETMKKVEKTCDAFEEQGEKNKVCEILNSVKNLGPKE